MYLKFTIKEFNQALKEINLKSSIEDFNKENYIEDKFNLEYLLYQFQIKLKEWMKNKQIEEELKDSLKDCDDLKEDNNYYE